MKQILNVLVSACILLGVAVAQSEPPAEPKILTNKDVVTLAKAGFTEDFIIDTILAGKSRFDISPNGLVELAREGLNERVVRAMAGVGTPSADAAARPAPPPSAQAFAPAQPVPYPQEMTMPAVEQRTRTRVVQPSRVGLAVAAQVPYYESTSLLFGLFHKKVAVGAVPQVDQILTPHMGNGAGGSRMMANFPTLVSPAGSRMRYVVIP